MRRLGFLAEAIENTRLCVTPTTIRRLKSKFDVEVLVEQNIGYRIGLNDSEFAEAGAQVMSREDVLHECDLLSFVELPEEDVCSLDNKVLVGMLNPKLPDTDLSEYLYRNITVFSLDMLPRTTRAQSMDVLSSLSSLAGYKAVIKSADHYGSVLPMMSTAAGTLKPAKVLVLGAGVAGLQAIATARRLGAEVEAFDVRDAAAEQVESLGARFIRVEGAVEDPEAGGYAIEQNEVFKQRQATLLSEKVKGSDIVICAAQIPGKKAPILVSSDQVESMRPGSVIMDLASSSGGNCELTQNGRRVLHRGVTILAGADLTKEVALASTNMLAENFYAFLEYFLVNHQIPDDEIIVSCKLIERGALVHKMFKTSERWEQKV